MRNNSYGNRQHPGRDIGELSLVDAFRVTARYRWMLFIIIAAGTAAGWLYQAAAPARYVAEALIRFESVAPEIAASDRLLPPPALNGEIIQTEVRVLGSRSHIRSVVIEHGLADDPFLAPRPAKPWLAPITEAFAVSVTRGPITEVEPDPAAGAPLASDPAPYFTIDAVMENLEVVRDGKTHVIAVRYASPDPGHAAQIANAIAERYVRTRLEDRYAYASRADQWLSEQLEHLKGRYDASAARLAARERELAEPSIDALVVHGDHLAAFNRELVNAQVIRQDKENRLAQVRSLISQGDIGGAIEDIGSSVILQNLHTLKAQLLRKEAELSSQLGPRHPRIQDIKNERRELLARINNEQRLLIKKFENDVALALERERAIEAELARMKDRQHALTTASAELDGLRQTVALDQRVYEEFLSQFKPIDNGDQVRAPDARIISEATPPASPAWPKSKMVIVIAFAASVGFGLILTYVRELNETGLRTSNDVLQALGLRPLAMVLRHKSRRVPAHDALIDLPNSASSESVRTLLEALLPTRSRRDRGRVLVVASTLPGEGKSTTALALARAAAADGIKTLLIDGDVRKPCLHTLAGLPRSPGLDVLLHGELQPKDVIIKDPKSNLAILPGPSTRDTKGLRIDRRAPFGRLFDRLRHRYELIVVDSSPLIAVVDAKVMMQHADDVLLLAAWRRTPKALVRDSIEGIDAAGGRLIGVALSQVDPDRIRAYEPADQSYSRKLVERYYTQ